MFVSMAGLVLARVLDTATAQQGGGIDYGNGGISGDPGFPGTRGILISWWVKGYFLRDESLEIDH
jgi:hypothetical protein